MKILFKLSYLSLFACLLTISGCKKDPDDTPDVIGPTNTQAQTISLQGGQLTLEIPVGAMAEGTQISMQESSAELPASAPVLHQFELLPKGAKFLKPVTLTLKYSDELLQGNSPYTIGLAFKNDDDGKWYALVGGKIDTDKKTISVKITHFSNWGVFSALHLYAKAAGKTYKDGEEVIPLLTNQLVEIGVVMDLPPLSADDEEMLAMIKKVFELMKKDPVNPDVSEDCADCALLAPVTFNPPVSTDDIHNTVIKPDKWMVNGIVNGNTTVGTISEFTNGYFFYTSPQKMPLDNPMAIAAVIHTKSHGELQLIQQANVYARKWHYEVAKTPGRDCMGFDDFGYAYQASYGGAIDFEIADGFELASEKYTTIPLKFTKENNCSCMTGIHLEPFPDTGISLSDLKLTVDAAGYEMFGFQVLLSGSGREYAEFKATWTTDDCGANDPHTESEVKFLTEEYYVSDFPLGYLPDTPLKTNIGDDDEVWIEAIE